MTDLIILVIVAVSAVVAYYRGLVRETFTIICWLGAAIVAFFLFPAGREVARGMIPVSLLADIVAGVVLFVAVLLPMILLTSTLTHQLNREGPVLVDRLAGILFGIVRGLFLVTIVYWANLLLIEPGSEPAWIKGSLSRPIIHKFANLLPESAPYFSDHSAGTGKPGAQTGDKATHAKAPSEGEAPDGYKQNDRRSLDQLITTTSEK